MEHDNASTINPEMIRLLLLAQDEILAQLQAIVSGNSNDNLAVLQENLKEQLQTLEKMEKQLWATLFPPDSEAYAAKHRMTMFHNSDLNQG